MSADCKATWDDLDAVARDAATRLTESPRRMPSTEVERLLIHRYDVSRSQARTVIRRLVTTEDLAYTYEFGCSFLEPSFRKPVRVGEKVVLVPADLLYRTAEQEVAVRLATGASFGCGRHPTTRLAIRGVEWALGGLSSVRRPEQSAVLDIGTGSGVLAIAAVKLGVERGLGVDTDPCARFEARQNVAHNLLTGEIHISAQPIETIKPTGRFYFVTANLRAPTLRNAVSLICRLVAPGGWLILSGIRAEELKGLCETYRIAGCQSYWTAVEKDWAAVVCQKQTA